jgi:hypothetical protein
LRLVGRVGYAQRMEDTVRHIIKDTLEELHRKTGGAEGSQRWLSLKLKRSHSYIQQYLQYGKPQDLDFDEKLKIHNILGIPLRDLGIVLPDDAEPSPAATSLGLTHDAEPFHYAEGSSLTPAPHISFYRALTGALDEHRLIIRPGDIILVDTSDAALAAHLVEGDAYLVKLFDKRNQLTATTVIRQYVKPHMLITNSTQNNSALSMEDGSLPFEPIIEGKIVSVMRQ